MVHKSIDNGRAYCWGNTAADYAKYRDIYPSAFFAPLLDAGLCQKGQRVLDLGTGTGVLPRSLYSHGASFLGIDQDAQQILQAKQLAADKQMNIDFQCCGAEQFAAPADSFDAVTACQCFFYFDHAALAPRIAGYLKPGGCLAALYMAWLPLEDEIAAASEALIRQYNPSWSGYGETRHPISLPDAYLTDFTLEQQLVFDLAVPFSRESWNGRIKACRGIGASLPTDEITTFTQTHLAQLAALAPPTFTVRHYAAITIARKTATSPSIG